MPGMTWLSNRITTPIDAPNLTSEGYTFLGGRLLPSDPEDGIPSPAAQLMMSEMPFTGSTAVGELGASFAEAALGAGGGTSRGVGVTS